MRNAIQSDISMIREGLESDDVLDYYDGVARFIAPYTLKIGAETLKAPMIFLCTGSKPFVPPIEGLDGVTYLTSDEVLNLESLPESLVIVGAGYIAAEYGHFFSAMGCKVTVIGNGPRVLQQEEPEISILAKREMEQYLDIHTGYRVVSVEENKGMKKLMQ
ncbi:FAD-dependent oxidoreductase [Methanohalophilus profundi]|uniref:FAD-dependent oxidoreductase n=1 Tax=Methanohalophilus profundi TaxID=2138083 RepID=UPI002989FA65|nr:FAD-dependent oxidoreductase [Methanohalophilus profundi]